MIKHKNTMQSNARIGSECGPLHHIIVCEPAIIGKTLIYCCLVSLVLHVEC